MNLDTRATVDTFLVNFDREGVRDVSSHDWITDVEARQLQGHDKKGKPGPLNGRFKDATAPPQFLMYPKRCALLPRSRAKNNVNSMWDTMVVT